MVKAKTELIRVVLDTNILVSALLFGGMLDPLVIAWKTGAVVPVFTRATFDEFRRVLLYPRFRLTETEIRILIEEDVLPFAEVVETREEIRGVCRDPADDMFLSCALAARAAAIVTGDKDLLDLGSFRSIPVVSAQKFVKQVKVRM